MKRTDPFYEVVWEQPDGKITLLERVSTRPNAEKIRAAAESAIHGKHGRKSGRAYIDVVPGFVKRYPDIAGHQLEAELFKKGWFVTYGGDPVGPFSSFRSANDHAEMLLGMVGQLKGMLEPEERGGLRSGEVRKLSTTPRRRMNDPNARTGRGRSGKSLNKYTRRIGRLSVTFRWIAQHKSWQGIIHSPAGQYVLPPRRTFHQAERLAAEIVRQLG